MVRKIVGQRVSLWRWWTSTTLLVLLATAPRGVAAEGSARVLIVLREGLLAPEEISPRSQGDASTLWSLALGGTSVATLVEPRELSTGGDLAQVAKFLLPESILNADRGLLLLELKAPVRVWSGESQEAVGLSFEELYRRVAPSPPSKGSTEKDPGGAGKGLLEEPERKSPAKGELLPPDPITTSRVTIVRVHSSDDTQELVHARDRFLAYLVDGLGEGAHVFVVTCPRDGTGSLVASGPQLKKGRVLGRKKSFSLIKSALVYLFEDSGKKSARHELFQ